MARPKRNPDRCRLTVELADKRRKQKLEKLRLKWDLPSWSHVVRKLIDGVPIK
jgi:hypothetical protein